MPEPTPEPEPPPPDYDYNDDGVVDRVDTAIITTNRNKTVAEHPEVAPYDLDGDGVVTVLDVRKHIYHYTNPL